MIGYVLSIALVGFNWNAMLIGLSSIVFHEIFKPDWKRIFTGILLIVVAIPRSIVVGIYTILLKEELFETVPNKKGAPEILSITLVPDSIVIISDETEHHIHRLVKR